MKKSDLAIIIFIAGVSVGVAALVVSSIPGLSLSSDTSASVQTIKRYTSEIQEPDKDVFNSAAINPTVDITIGGTQSSSGNN